MTRSVPFAILIVAVLLEPARVGAQDQRSQPHVTLRGTIRRSDGTPLPGAVVSVESASAIVLVSVRSNALGAYYIEYVGANADPWISAMLIGYRKERRRIASQGDGVSEHAFDFSLRETAIALSATRIVAHRPRPTRDANARTSTPGANQATIDRGSGLSGDVSGDLTAALGMVPGVTLITNADGTVSASVGGLGQEQNSATLNGSDFTGGSLPRDGLLQTVRISTYDPKVGRFGGLQISSNLPSGTILSLRSLRATVDDPSLQRTTSIGSSFGNTSRDLIVSGTASGPLVTDRMFFSSAVQIGRRAGDLVTLETAPRPALDAIGVSRDSVDRLLAIARAIGLPTAGRAPPLRTTSSGSAIGRIDFTPNAQSTGDSGGDVLYLLGSTSWKEIDALGAVPTAMATRLYQNRHRDGQLLLSYSPYFASALNEARVSVSIADDRTMPYVRLPAAFLLLNSSVGSASGAARLEFGGNGGSQSVLRNDAIQASNETSWMTLDHSHRFSLFLDADVQRFSLQQTANSLGTYTYASLQDLSENRPSSYLRTPTALTRGGQVSQGVFALSDLFYVSRASRNDFAVDGNGLTVQYGIRVDAQRFGAAPENNPSIDSAFGARTDHVPTSVAIQPMLGFSWKAGIYAIESGPTRFTLTRSRLDGGVRLYRSTLSPLSVDAVARQTGLPGATDGLECVGAAVPAPDWRAIARTASALPDACAQGTGSSLVEMSQPVRFYAQDFTLPQSWRGELNWSWVISGYLSGQLGGSVSSNITQTSPFDVNFSAVRRFTLSDEAGRPIFVSPLSVDPRSGIVASTESRLAPGFAHVTELRSDIQSRTRQFTAGLTYRYGAPAFVSGFESNPRRFAATIRGWYSYTASRTQFRGFAGTTSDDPRVAAWSEGAVPAHAVQVVVQAHLDRWFDVSFSARLNSGMPFTPIVGSDINGDGYANDRAFVFDPARTSDTELQSAMRSVIARAPAAVQSCLRAQLGRLAEANSCHGPWTAALGTLAITVHASRLGLGNRGSLVLYINNVLGGLDQLLHGDSHLAGWGDPGLVDPVLLNPKGFDPSTRRFLYAVNPLFGTTTAFSAAFRQPTRLTIDFRLDVSHNLESLAIAGFVRRGIGDEPLTTNRLKLSLLSAAGMVNGGDIDRILRRADSLRLTSEQEQHIRALRDRLVVDRDSLYGSLAEYLVAQQGEYDSSPVRTRWHDDIVRSIRQTFNVGRHVRELLSAEQLTWLRNHRLTLSLEYSSDWLERTTSGYQLLPR
jgi:hypothetical protein